MKKLNPAAKDEFPSAVFFDLDDTLYPYQPSHEHALSSVANKAKTLAGISETDFLGALDVARVRVKNRLGNSAAAHSRLIYFKETLELCGLGAQPLISLELEKSYWSSFISKMQLFEDAAEFLDDLRAHGVPMILITDLTLQIQLRKIAFLGLEKYFDVVVTSEEAGSEKPAAAPFRLALEKTGALSKQTWYVGDSSERDVVGARSNIERVTVFQRVDSKNQAGHGPEQPDYSFEEFRHLREYLGKLNKND